MTDNADPALRGEIPQPGRRVGRYLLHSPIASGGMATVHFGALIGEAGFSRTVAIKRLHTARPSKQLVTSLLDEARLLSRVQHPNVVPTLDVVMHHGEVFVVLEYVVGESLSRLLRACEQRGEQVPMDFATSIVASVLHGLHAAHDAKSPHGKPLGIVHRDVSPQNIMVGVDGLARVLDFGIATASERLSKSVSGQVKGKLAYMAPEQFRGESDRRTDIYSTAVVLWELLAGRRLFHGDTPGELLEMKIAHEVDPPSRYRPEVPAVLDAIVMKALSQAPGERHDSARQLAHALEDCMGVARASLVGAWVQQLAGAALSQRAQIVAALERDAAEQTGEAPIAGVDEPHAGRFTEELVSSDDAARPRGAVTLVDEDAETRQLGMAPREDVTTAAYRPSRDETLTSAAVGDAAPRPSERRWLAIAAIALGGLAAWLWSRPPRDELAEQAVAPEPPATETRSDTGEAITTSASAMTTSASAMTTSATEMTTSAMTTTSATPTAAPAPPRIVTAPPILSAAPAASAQLGAGCDPPYTVDARGVRRLKPECL